MRKPSDVDFPFLWNIFKRRYQYVIAFGVFCAAITFIYLKYIQTPVYRVDFSLYAWDYDGDSETAAATTTTRTTQLQAANTIDRELVVADKMLNDYEKLMGSRYVNSLVRDKLSLEYPELTLEGIPYRRMLASGKGSPVGTIHDGNCSNCNMKNSPQTAMEAAHGNLVNCEYCSYFLYDPDAKD